MSKGAGSTVVEVPGGHAVSVSQPQAVGWTIDQIPNLSSNSMK
jgi:hypothetical protein